jgi:hypothetical protein
VYNKIAINDTLLNFDDIAGKTYLNPLRKFMYVRPLYAKHSEFSKHTPGTQYILRILGALLMLKLGYELGNYESEVTNKVVKASKVVEFESEEQVFDFLFNKKVDAVFMHLHTPGNHTARKFYHTMEEASSDPRHKDIVFMNVPCRKHISFCMGKAFN